LFKPGEADLQLEARPLLDAVIRVVNKHPEYKIHIQGHTDDEPISTERFPTNWELSSARATAVLRYFIDKGSEPERMTATGYADTFPLGRNDTVPGRAKNRRVEFVLEKEK
jgi:chemotaxis protein MotB